MTAILLEFQSQWLQAGGKMESFYMTVLFLKTENNSLVIHNTTFEDEGSYDCKTLQVYEFGGKVQIITTYVEVIGEKFFCTIIKH